MSASRFSMPVLTRLMSTFTVAFASCGLAGSRASVPWMPSSAEGPPKVSSGASLRKLASKSDHLAQISGLAADFSGFNEPSGNSFGICFDVSTSFCASGTRPATSPALVLSWMFFHAAPWSFISCCRAAIASSGFICPIEAQPTATTGTSAAAVSIHVRRLISSPRVRGTGRPRVDRLPLLLLGDLVPDRWKRLQILRDGDAVALGEVLVAGQRAVDHLAHQTTGHVAVRLVAGTEVVRDLLHRPLADPRVRIGRDVRHRLILRPLGIAREEPAVVGGHHQRARSVAFTAVRDRAHEILAARPPRGRRRRGRCLAWRERGQPRRQEHGLAERPGEP